MPQDRFAGLFAATMPGAFVDAMEARHCGRAGARPSAGRAADTLPGDAGSSAVPGGSRRGSRIAAAVVLVAALVLAGSGAWPV